MKHKDIDIVLTSPFENCKLDREKYADVLTQIVSSYSEGFVLALNNSWGDGKTTFVKMWRQSLTLKNYETVYFNAWENDFEDDALAAIIGELRIKIGSCNQIKFAEIVHKASVISKKIVPLLAKAIVSKYTGVSDFTVLTEETVNGFAEVFEKSIEEYAKKKETVVSFKKALEEYLEANLEKRPLVFFIDELDRCRPNYAVSVLEQIKHFFSIEGIVFVLSIDKTQLGNAVKGVYGSHEIDADEYLRRFIDVEFTLPSPSSENYISYLYKYFKFQEFFDSPHRSGEDPHNFKLLMKILFSSSNISLRQQEKIFAHSKLVLSSFQNSRSFYPVIVCLLIFLRTLHQDKYRNVVKKRYSIEEFYNMVFDIISIDVFDKNDIYLLPYIEAYIIYFVAKLQKSDYEISAEILSFQDDYLPFKSSPLKVKQVIQDLYRVGYSFNPQDIIDRIELLTKMS